MHARMFLTSWSMRKKLVLFLFIILVPVIGIVIVSSVYFRQRSIEAAKNNTFVFIQGMAAQQEQVTARTRQMLETLARLPAVRHLNAETCNNIFSVLHEQNPFYSAIMAMTPDGNVFAASLPFQPGTVNLGDRKYFKEVIKTDRFVIGEYIFGRVSKVPLISYAYPVFGEGHTLVAILVAGFKLNEYERFIEKAKLPEGSVVSIVDRSGVRMFRFPEYAQAAPGRLVAKDSLEEVFGEIEQGSFERTGEDGVHRIYAFRQLGVNENAPPYLYMLVGIPKEKTLHEANLVLQENLLLLSLTSCITMFLIWFSGNYVFIRPIKRLVIATKRFGEGRLETRTELPHSVDDLGQLAKSFDDMALQLELREKQRLQAEEALRRSEEEYRCLFETQIDFYYKADAQGKILLASPSILKASGYTSAELIGSDIRILYAHPEDRNTFLAAIAEKGFVEDYEVLTKGKNGSLSWLAVNARLNRDQDGKIVSVEGVARDISDRKQAEEALRKSEEKFRLLVENSRDIIYSLTAEGQFVFVSPSWTRMLGHPIQEVVGKTFEPFIHPKDLPACKDFFQALTEKGQGRESIEYRMRHIDGTWCWHASSIVSIHDNAGKVAGFYGIARDISERRKKDAELLDLIAKLRMAAEEIKTLRGIVPICSNCKKIRDDKGYWEQVEGYVAKHTEAKFSHGICPDCLKEFYPDYYDLIIETPPETKT